METHGTTTGEGRGRTMSPANGLEGNGMDLDPSRRPGSPMLHDPQPLPNARIPPERQQSDVQVFMHGRPNKTFPPVFGTAVPPKGLSGRIRAAAYARPDHETVHWLLLLLSDRVDAWEHRLGQLLPLAAGAGSLGGVVYYARRRAEARGWSRRGVARRFRHLAVAR